jgi:hypothetical protein
MHEDDDNASSAQAQEALLGVARELRHFDNPGGFERAICRMANTLTEVLIEKLRNQELRVRENAPVVTTSLVAVAQMLLAIEDEDGQTPTKALVLLLAAQAMADGDTSIPGGATNASVDEEIWASIVEQMDQGKSKYREKGWG